MKNILKKYFELEKSDRIILFLHVTTFSSLFMCIIKFSLSFILPSLWFFINALFNAVLALLRTSSIRDYQKMKKIQNEIEKEKIGFKNYLNNGVMLIILGILYFGVSAYTYFKGTNTNMHEYLTYLVACIAFYSIGSAIYGMIKYRKTQNPIISAVKVTNFANALTSIVLTQVVLLDTFKSDINTHIADGIIGIIVSITIIGLGLYMILGIKKYISEEV